MEKHHMRSNIQATARLDKPLFAFLLLISLASAAAEVNATVSVTVVSRATISFNSFGISASSVTQGRPMLFTAAFNNTGNSGGSFTVTVYLVNSSNVTVQTITFSPVLILEGESASASKSAAITAAPGNYTLLATGSYGAYLSDSMTSSLVVNAAPSAPVAAGGAPFFLSVPSAPQAAVAERPVVTALDLVDGEQLSVSFYPPGEEVRAYANPSGSDLTGITGVAATLAERMTDSRIIIRYVPAGYPSNVPEPPPSVYKRISVETVNIGPGSIRSLSISFKVSRIWESGQFDKNTVALYRFADNKWNRLPTSLIGSDDKSFYYVASSPGLSYFAIVAEAPQPFDVISYPMVEEIPPGRMVTHAVAISNPGADTSSGTVSLSGVPSEWIVDPVRTVSVDPFSTLNVRFIVFVPSNATPGESALLTNVMFGDSEKSILTALRVVGPRENGVYVYRTITADVARNETKVTLSSENALQTRADVVEVSDRLPSELQLSKVTFITEPSGYSDGVVSYAFPLDSGVKRVDEFVLDTLFDSYSIYLNWAIDQVSTMTYPAHAIGIDSVFSTSFQPGGAGKVNITLINHGTSPTTVILRLSLPERWMAVPLQATDNIQPRSASSYEFEVNAPSDAAAGAYPGKAAVFYELSSLEAPLSLVVTSPAVTVIETSGLAASATTLILAIAFIAALIFVLISFRKRRKARAR
ncbi:NPCBM-associated, NEW3 domain of alpha-galactosidase [uncultured archaeon]|nr:NPCBM-associated, NEW3 domain of alpha-galactosidase [uncultured archaeon]